MILLVGLALVALSVPLAGGRFTWLARVPLGGFGWVLWATVLQVVVVNVLPNALPAWAASSLHLVSYACVLAFLVANRQVIGLWLVALGGGMNLVAIVTNGGVMPARVGALQAAGRDVHVDGFTNSAATTDAPLWFLGDVFAWPAPLPLSNVFSVGDIVLVFGAAVIVHVHTGTRLGRRLSHKRRQAVLGARRDRLRRSVASGTTVSRW